MKYTRLFILRSILLGLSFCLSQVFAQTEYSVARRWNEILLEGIRNDLARPTVHARNLFHISSAMYDAWAVYDEQASPYLLSRMVQGFPGSFVGVPTSANPVEDQEKAMSYAAYRLIQHRFKNSPGASETLPLSDAMMFLLGYETGETSTYYQEGNAAALGNYIAELYIAYGLQDGSNEANDYANQYYLPLNEPLDPERFGNFFMPFPDRWQPLAFDLFIDQSGNPISGEIPEFLSPEWGNVLPFSLQSTDSVHYQRSGRGGGTFPVYVDPGPPPYLDGPGSELDNAYKWGFVMVAIWSAHLDILDGVMWDISPASIGNVSFYPEEIENLPEFYDFFEGGDPSRGHALNPATGLPYEPQMVPRGDYTRVLAEFWADGPDSETPPGHWFTILNYVADQPEFSPRFEGQGPELSRLEWDVKSYFTLGGTMHDAAIAAWSVKGWYDYLRPISAIRYMATLGQCSDPRLPNFHPDGIPLVPGYIELVTLADSIYFGRAVEWREGRVKLKGWRGPNYISNPETDAAGVGWIMAEDWWPYQRPTFVTPPFAGYVSGHSTYSRAAAEVLTALTGDPFFPGGMGEFEVKKNEFLVFEEGPSQDFTLQWATYQDASDQTSLSRIWGGIHPPADDIPGRLMGDKIGKQGFAFAKNFFTGSVSTLESEAISQCFPNPVQASQTLWVPMAITDETLRIRLMDLSGRVAYSAEVVPSVEGTFHPIAPSSLSPGIYLVEVYGEGQYFSEKVLVRP